jgi:hypothetical protein
MEWKRQERSHLIHSVQSAVHGVVVIGIRGKGFKIHDLAGVIKRTQRCLHNFTPTLSEYAHPTGKVSPVTAHCGSAPNSGWASILPRSCIRPVRCSLEM